MLCSVLNTSKTFKNVDINSREREIERHRPDRYLLISRTVLQALTVPKLSRSTEKLLDVYIVKQYQWIMLFDNGYAFVLNITNIFWP